MRARFVFEAIKHLSPKSDEEIDKIYLKDHFGEKKALELCEKYLPYLKVEFIYHAEKSDNIDVIGDSVFYADDYFKKWDILDVNVPLMEEDGYSLELIIGIPKDADNDEDIHILFYGDATLFTQNGASDEDLDPVPIDSFTKKDWNSMLRDLYDHFNIESKPKERNKIRQERDKWAKMKKDPNEPYYRDDKALGLFDKEKHYQWDEEDQEWHDTQERSLKRDERERREKQKPNWEARKKDPNDPYFVNHKGWDVSSSKRGGRDWLWDENKKEWINAWDRSQAEDKIRYDEVLSHLPQYKKEITEAIDNLAKKYKAKLQVSVDNAREFGAGFRYNGCYYELHYTMFGLEGKYDYPEHGAGGISVKYQNRNIKRYVKAIEDLINKSHNSEWWKKVHELSKKCEDANGGDRYAITKKTAKCYPTVTLNGEKLYRWSTGNNQWMLNTGED